MDNHLNSIELFTGAGGLALGISNAGFKPLALIEIDKHSCATLKRNNETSRTVSHEWPVHTVDVRDFDFRPYEGVTDLLAAGVPCQPFSLAGKHKGKTDNRNMFPALMEAIRAVWPKVILIENVRGLLRPNFLPYFEYILLQLQIPTRERKKGESWRQHKARLIRELGKDGPCDLAKMYWTDYRLVECADYGVPQRRRRVFVVAFRKDLDIAWDWPEKTHSAEALLYAQWVDKSYWREHKIKSKAMPNNLRARIDALKELGKPKELRWRTVRDALKGLPEPINGVSHLKVKNHVGIPGARVYPGHAGSELDWPAKTLKAGVHGVPGGEATIIPDDEIVRYLTVRESARLQCFPDRYEFVGVRSEAMRQIGNAVPVTIAELMAKQIIKKLSTAQAYSSQTKSKGKNLAPLHFWNSAHMNSR